MKKVVSLVLALAMVASLCTAVFAAGSKTDLFEVTADSPVEVAETEEEEPAEEEAAAAVTAAVEAVAAEESEYIDAEVLEAASAGTLTLAAMGDYAITEDAVATEDGKYQITIYGEGTEDWDIIVMAKYEGAEDWEVVYAGAGGEFTFEVEADGTFAIYVVE